MRGSLKISVVLALALVFLAAAPASSAQMVSSTTRGVSAVMQADGFHIRPAGSAGQFGGDLAPVQTFEIVRPGNQRITIGRLFTSCTCVRLEAPRQSYEPGEPAILHLRNIHPTPQAGQMYAIYVQITSPIRTTLRFDTFVRSSQFIPAGLGETPTRGNITADGVMPNVTAYEGEIELIVPKADNYVEDTSEYTMKKKAELDNAEGVVQEVAEKEDGDEVVAKADDSEKEAEEVVADKAGSIEEKAEDATVAVKDKAEAVAGETAAKLEETAVEAAKASQDMWAEVKTRGSDTVAKATETVEKAASETAVAVDSTAEEAKTEVAEIGDAIVEKAEAAKIEAGEVKEALAEKAEAAKEEAAAATDAVAEEVAAAKAEADEAKEALAEKVETVKKEAAAATDAAIEKTETVAETAKADAREVGDSAEDDVRKAIDEIEELGREIEEDIEADMDAAMQAAEKAGNKVEAAVKEALDGTPEEARDAVKSTDDE